MAALEDQLPDLIKQTPKILPMVYADLAQPSVIKVGKALETVFEFSTSLLLPLKLLNEKFKINFERNLNDYKKKIESIPEEKICDVNPQIGTPIIERLTYTTNEEIADLFTTLLSKATSTETLSQAHPSFVQFVERLSVDEARLIKFLKSQLEKGWDFIPFISFRGVIDIMSRSFRKIDHRVTLLPLQIKFLFPQNVVTYIDNFISMGIFDCTHGNYKSEDKFYEAILKRSNYEVIKNDFIESGEFKDVKYDKSYIQITDFGKLFINACTMDETKTNTIV